MKEGIDSQDSFLKRLKAKSATIFFARAVAINEHYQKCNKAV